jgi:drug/metabolite transporter (DMT)-like permease
MSVTDWLLLMFLSAVWGGSFYFAKIAVLEIPPLTLAFGRVSIAAAALIVVIRLLGVPIPRDGHTWRMLALLAVLNNALPFTLLFWGQIYISIGLASILNATTPLFGVMVAHLLTRDDRLTIGRVVGVAAGFVGVIMLLGADLMREFGTHALAELACLGAACSYAFGAVLSRRLRHHPPIIVAGGQLTMSTAILAPLVLMFGQPSAMFTSSNTAITAMVALALLSSALAYFIYFRIIQRAGATNALLVTFLTPISAIVLGMALLSETLEMHHVAGMAAIFVGIAAIDGRPARFLARILAR